jgi:glutamate-ammonia-ligase adenylyltransferase
MDVAKPATHRPRLPGVGRLGLVEKSAPGNLTALGWDTDAHVELLWSLSRAPNADTALHGVARLAESLGEEWHRLDAALLKDRSLRGRLFAVLGSSLALADHLVASPASWHLLEGALTLPGPEGLRAIFDEAIAEFGCAPVVVMPKLRVI